VAERNRAQVPTFDPIPDEPEVQEITELASVVQAFVAKAGVDIATITGTTSIKTNGTVYWGTATGVYTNTQYQESKPEYQPDNTLQWRLTFTLPGLQLQAAQAYFAKVFFVDGTSTSELTWTQPALNASGSDQVFFYDKVVSSFATVVDVAIRGADQGWLSADEYTAFQNRIAATAWLNTVKWNDGR